MLEEHVKEQNDFYKEITGEDKDYTDMQSALWHAMDIGLKVLTGNIDSEISTITNRLKSILTLSDGNMR